MQDFDTEKVLHQINMSKDYDQPKKEKKDINNLFKSKNKRKT
ncbi:4516_t:CDS:1, partial [Scutellospora calospora]